MLYFLQIYTMFLKLPNFYGKMFTIKKNGGYLYYNNIIKTLEIMGCGCKNKKPVAKPVTQSSNQTTTQQTTQNNNGK